MLALQALLPDATGTVMEERMQWCLVPLLGSICSRPPTDPATVLKVGSSARQVAPTPRTHTNTHRHTPNQCTIGTICPNVL